VTHLRKRVQTHQSESIWDCVCYGVPGLYERYTYVNWCQLMSLLKWGSESYSHLENSLIQQLCQYNNIQLCDVSYL